MSRGRVPPKERKIDQVDPVLRKKLATLMSVRGFKQQTIAETFHVASSTVKRWLDDADRFGWLVYQLNEAKFGDEERRSLEALVAEDPELFASLQDRLSKASPNPVRLWLLSTKDYYCAAAAVVRRVLESAPNGRLADRVGVAWGRCLRGVLVDGLQQWCKTPFRSRNPVRFVPLRGDALTLGTTSPDSGITPSAICCAVSRIVNGTHLEPTLLGAGASPVIPARCNLGIGFSLDQAHIIRTFLERVMFPLYDDLDVILTSVGPADPHSSFTLRCFDAAGLPTAALVPGKSWYGDLAGIPIYDPERIDKNALKYIKEFEEVRLLGLQRLQLEKVVRAANGIVAVFVNGDQDRRDGVGGRVRCLAQCIKAGLVTELVIDGVAGVELLELLPKSPARTRHP